jgi:arylsulfatase B
MGAQKKHAAMISAMDDGIGNVMRAVHKNNISDNTLVLFVSDNGGLERDGASNAPLRGQKQAVFEGGVRVPATAWWPGHIKPGKTSFDAPMCVIDIYPTLQHIAGIKDKNRNPIDGKDLSAIWEGNKTTLKRDLFMYWGQNKGKERLAMWRGDWKLVYNGPSLLKASARDRKHLYLFKLRNDPDEKKNLESSYPDKVKSMLARLQEFRRLRPKNGIPPYGVGRKGFKAPPLWNMKLYGKQ